MSTHSYPHSHASNHQEPDPFLLNDSIPWFPIHSIEVLFEVASLLTQVSLVTHVRQQHDKLAELIFPVPIPWGALIQSCEAHFPTHIVQGSLRTWPEAEALKEHPQAQIFLFHDRIMGPVAWLKSAPHSAPIKFVVRYNLPHVHEGSWHNLMFPLHASPPPTSAWVNPSLPNIAAHVLKHLSQARRVARTHPLLPRHSIYGRVSEAAIRVETLQSSTHTIELQKDRDWNHLQALPNPGWPPLEFAMRWMPRNPNTDSGVLYFTRNTSQDTVHTWIQPPAAPPSFSTEPSMFPHPAPLDVQVVIDMPKGISIHDKPGVASLLSIISSFHENPRRKPEACLLWLHHENQTAPANNQRPSWLHFTPDSFFADTPDSSASSSKCRALIWILDGTAWNDRTDLCRQLSSQHPGVHLFLLGWPHDEARLREKMLGNQGTWIQSRSWGQPPQSERSLDAWLHHLLNPTTWKTIPPLDHSPDLNLGYGIQKPLRGQTHIWSLPLALTRQSATSSDLSPLSSPSFTTVLEYLEIKSPFLIQHHWFTRMRRAEASPRSKASSIERISMKRGFLSLLTCLVGLQTQCEATAKTPVIVQPWAM